MQLVIFEKGFNYSQDGVGNRLVYYLQGCNMNCPWCANPEGISISPPILVDGKNLLDSVCPHGAIKNQALDRCICIACDRRECLNLYKSKGIGCKGKAIEVDAIVQEAGECVPMFFDNGGVTLTGGEPTLQFDDVSDLFVKLHAAGIHTAMETNGTCPDLPALFPLIDQLMMDLKHYDSAVLRAVTGVGNETIMDNLRKATVAHKAVNIRIPLIYGFNTSEDNLFGGERRQTGSLPAADAMRVCGPNKPYPDELYYACDKLGIMVWQDFPTDGSQMPDSPEYTDLFLREAEHMVRRLKHHPSIFLWCGGNENIYMCELYGKKTASGSKCSPMATAASACRWIRNAITTFPVLLTAATPTTRHMGTPTAAGRSGCTAQASNTVCSSRRTSACILRNTRVSRGS